MPFRKKKNKKEETSEDVYHEITDEPKKPKKLFRFHSRKKAKSKAEKSAAQAGQQSQIPASSHTKPGVSHVTTFSTTAHVSGHPEPEEQQPIEYEDVGNLPAQDMPPGDHFGNDKSAGPERPKSSNVVPPRPPKGQSETKASTNSTDTAGQGHGEEHVTSASPNRWSSPAPEDSLEGDQYEETGDFGESLPEIPPKTEGIQEECKELSSVSNMPIPSTPEVSLTPRLCIDGSSSLPSMFDRPWDICVSPTNGNIYITDVDRSQIMQFDQSGKLFMTVGNHGNENGEFNEPRGIALSIEGNIVVCDSKNNRIQVLGANGNFIRKFGGQGNKTHSLLSRPFGVAVSPTNIVYITECGNHRVQMRTIEGAFLRAFGSGGSLQSQLKRPQGIALTGNGNVIVADTGNHRLQVYSANGDFETSIGREGTDPGEFMSPKSVTASGANNLIIADDHNNRVQVLSSDGRFLYALGGTSRGTEEGEFDQPTGVAVDGDNSIYVCDHCNRRIQIF